MAGMNAGSPGSDPSFNPSVPMPGPGGPGPGQQQFGAPGSRLTGPPNNKPMSMLPPPSPAKDQNGPNKDNKGNTHPDGSPRNQPLSGPNAPGTAPPTPGASTQGQPGQNQNMAQSPGLIMNPNTSSMNPAAMPLPPPPASSTENLFSTDFIQNVANGLDEFDVGLFRGDGDINFERDFGEWFNPDNMGSMELGKQ
jgi:collagen type III alpha